MNNSLSKSNVKSFKGKNGTYGVGSTPKQIVTPSVSAIPNDFEGKAVLGTVTSRIEGTLTISGNNWHFIGTMTVLPDTYDFNVRGSKRTSVGQLSTMGGAFTGFVAQANTLGAVEPENYEIILSGSIAVDASGSF